MTTSSNHSEYGPVKNPEVSIVINCLNGERYLQETLGSAFAQTFDDWEIVLWDNASTDRTGEIAAAYGEKVRYFRGETTVPLSQARNLAFNQARGKFIAVLDADDIWLPEKLERQLELFRANDDVGLVFCDSTLFDGGGDRYRLFESGNPKRGRVFGDLLSRNFIFTSTMMFRRSALDSLGYAFDETYTRVQDYELSLRMAYKFSVDYVDRPLCRWRMYQDSQEWRKWKNSLIPRVIEVRACVEKLIEKYPDIPERYPAELRSFLKDVDYGFAINAWEQGNSSEARKYLFRYLGDKKFTFVYFCTMLMKFSWFENAKNLVRNNTTRRGNRPKNAGSAD